jgi:hypothetical protein
MASLLLWDDRIMLSDNWGRHVCYSTTLADKAGRRIRGAMWLNHHGVIFSYIEVR